jgi:hypothetical protein
MPGKIIALPDMATPSTLPRVLPDKRLARADDLSGPAGAPEARHQAP